MAVPDFQSFFKPLLDLAADGNEHSIREARKWIAMEMHLGEDDLEERLPSGTQKTFDNRVAWAKSYFVQAKVFESSKRAHFKITDRGRELHKQGHERIDIKILNQYPEFLEFHAPPKTDKKETQSTEVEEQSSTPEEVLQKAYLSIRNELSAELLSKVKSNTPGFFEDLVVDLMVAMGYGGSRADAGESLGRSGDEGIDGIIKEDRLGLDVIYLQAKRWEGSVGRPELQKFVGALHGKRAKKGVFITTGIFTKEAIDYVMNIEPKVILIDGKKLTQYMIDFNRGTTTSTVYEIKKIDMDYFSEDD
ncbi:MAG: restriction endonuclease [Bacteroidota bacterium]